MPGNRIHAIVFSILVVDETKSRLQVEMAKLIAVEGHPRPSPNHFYLSSGRLNLTMKKALSTSIRSKPPANFHTCGSLFCITLNPIVLPSSFMISASLHGSQRPSNTVLPIWTLGNSLHQLNRSSLDLVAGDHFSPWWCRKFVTHELIPKRDSLATLLVAIVAVVR